MFSLRLKNNFGKFFNPNSTLLPYLQGIFHTHCFLCSHGYTCISSVCRVARNLTLVDVPQFENTNSMQQDGLLPFETSLTVQRIVQQHSLLHSLIWQFQFQEPFKKASITCFYITKNVFKGLTSNSPLNLFAAFQGFRRRDYVFVLHS